MKPRHARQIRAGIMAARGVKGWRSYRSRLAVEAYLRTYNKAVTTSGQVR